MIAMYGHPSLVAEQSVMLEPLICGNCLVEFVSSACPECGLHLYVFGGDGEGVGGSVVETGSSNTRLFSALRADQA